MVKLSLACSCFSTPEEVIALLVPLLEAKLDLAAQKLWLSATG
jgi:hypothetical protein